MSLLGAIFGGDKKTTTNTTQNTTQVTSIDTRTAASDNAVAVGQDGFLDQSLTYTDRSQYADNSVTNIMTADPEVAAAGLSAAVALGGGAFELVNQGLAAQALAAQENRLLAQNAGNLIAQSTSDALAQTLAVIGTASNRAFDLAESGQSESAAARVGAQDTIATVLAAKEGADTQITKDLLKYGAWVAAAIAVLFFFRKK